MKWYEMTKLGEVAARLNRHLYVRLCIPQSEKKGKEKFQIFRPKECSPNEVRLIKERLAESECTIGQKTTFLKL